ncbi:hypothetical protein BJ912DRAFT_195213 [Pholiota molesta]|nr:hypothetical protein BJ912DRAFT_195213 [Pholiota molesta]
MLPICVHLPGLGSRLAYSLPLVCLSMRHFCLAFFFAISKSSLEPILSPYLLLSCLLFFHFPYPLQSSHPGAMTQPSTASSIQLKRNRGCVDDFAAAPNACDQRSFYVLTRPAYGSATFVLPIIGVASLRLSEAEQDLPSTKLRSDPTQGDLLLSLKLPPTPAAVIPSCLLALCILCTTGRPCYVMLPHLLCALGSRTSQLLAGRILRPAVVILRIYLGLVVFLWSPSFNFSCCTAGIVPRAAGLTARIVDRRAVHPIDQPSIPSRPFLPMQYSDNVATRTYELLTQDFRNAKTANNECPSRFVRTRYAKTPPARKAV